MRLSWIAPPLLVPLLAAATALEPPRVTIRQPALASPEDGPVLGAATPPVIGFRLLMEFACPAGSRPSGLFVSIADTAVSAPSADSPLEVSLQVPAAQLAGIQAAASCETREPRRLSGQVSAFATLRCASDDGAARSAATVSQPIDLWLDCTDLQGRQARPGAESLLDD